MACLEDGIEHLAHQMFLGREVAVEAAMGETGIGHQARDANSVHPVLAKPFRRDVEDPFAGLVLVALTVTHGSNNL